MKLKLKCVYGVWCVGLTVSPSMKLKLKCVYGVCVCVFTDADECTNGVSQCQHTCVNIIGSFRCGCKPGFALQTDRTTCRKGLLPCVVTTFTVVGMEAWHFWISIYLKKKCCGNGIAQVVECGTCDPRVVRSNLVRQI